VVGGVVHGLGRGLVFLNWTAVHDVTMNNVHGVVSVAHEWHVQRVECVDGVVELVQVHFTCVLVAQALHDPLHL